MKPLSITDSSVLKGIAILMMLFHHVFYNPNDGYLDFRIGDVWCINSLAAVCKLCVAVFVFISGYGLMTRYKDVEHINLWEYYKRRFVKLMFNYWFVWLIFVPISVLWLGPSLAAQYNGTHISIKLILDFLGIVNWINPEIYPYNPAWWFYGCIIALYIVFPLLHNIVRSNILYVFALWVALYSLPSYYLFSVRLYLLTFICGMILAFKVDKINITPPRKMGMDNNTFIVASIKD